IKISADAENFKKEIAAANSAVETFRKNAASAGKEITAAFAGLIDTDISTDRSAARPAEVTVPDGYAKNAAGKTSPVGIPSYVPKENITGYYENNSYSRTANVLELDENETVIGAANGNSQNEQPINITTTVELDGDKIGESVNVYNMRRNKITNGLYN
ncbi:MAG: hypothetical protein IK093_03420, partial [Ruminiclostridium sp.]|nr:hypothetical protein [Ruminiclostridium sp.]